MNRILTSLATGVFLAAPVVAQTNLWRINCGGGAESAPGGPDFIADVPYSGGGGAGYVGGATVAAFYMGGDWNEFDAVHKTSRTGFSAYRFDVPNGDYILRLHLAETEKHGALERVFDLQAEGTTIQEDLDVAQLFGREYGAVFATTVQVSDGRLDLTVPGGESPAILSGIEVWTAPSQSSRPDTVAGLTVKPGYHRNIIQWEPSFDPGVVGYRIFRAVREDAPSKDEPAGFGKNRRKTRGEKLADVWALPPRFFDDSASLEHPESYQVVAIDHLGQLSGPSRNVSAQAMRSTDSPLDVYELLIDPLDWKLLNETFRTDRKGTVPATLLYRGQSYPCEARYRGQTSLTLPKKSWKLKFADGQRFQGKSQLNFKAHFRDQTMLRQEIGMSLFRSSEQATPDSSMIHFRVNGVFMGVFQSLEKINSDYLRARDRDDDGNIYSAQTNGLVELGPWDLAKIQTEFEQETNEGESWDDLVAFIDLINNTSDLDFPNAIAGVLDLDSYLSYIATNAFLVDFEAVIRNYNLHHDLELDRWEVLPWDNDASFSYPFIPIDFGTEGSWVGNNVLKTRVLAVPAYRWRYVDKLREVLDGPATTGVDGELSALVEAWHALLLADVSADVFKRGWEDDENFLTGDLFFNDTGNLRRNQLLVALDGYQPATPPTDVWINEFMAKNQSTLADAAGDFDDWVELYNASDAPVDVGGMYLTDDLALPTQWPIPLGTVIPAGGHHLVWLDGEPLEGAMHATFSLRRKGEELALFDTDGTTLLDFKHFNPQRADVSLGRSTDGGAFFREMGAPTPGNANSMAGNLPPRVTNVHNEPKAATSSETMTVRCLARDADGIARIQLWWAASGSAFQRVAMSPVGNDLFEAQVPPQVSGTVVEYFVRAIDTSNEEVLSPPDAPVDFYTYGVADPQVVTLTINEVMSTNQNVLADEQGDFDDWIELFNYGGAPVDLSGMYLSDDPADSTMWSFPIGTVLGPGEHLLVWADNEVFEGPLHTNFGLSSAGDDLLLFDSLGAGNGLIEAIDFGTIPSNQSFGLLPDGGSLPFRLIDPTPGAGNVKDTGFVRYASVIVSSSAIGMSSLGAPGIGTNATFFVGGGSASGTGFLVGGFNVLDAPAPYAGRLLVSPNPTFTTPITLDVAGNATVLVPIPFDAGLIGAKAFFQAQLSMDGASNGVALTITN